MMSCLVSWCHAMSMADWWWYHLFGDVICLSDFIYNVRCYQVISCAIMLSCVNMCWHVMSCDNMWYVSVWHLCFRCDVMSQSWYHVSVLCFSFALLTPICPTMFQNPYLWSCLWFPLGCIWQFLLHLVDLIVTFNCK